MPTRVLFYTHNASGVGHQSRVLKIAAFLQREIRDLAMLVLTASHWIHRFHLPPGVDVVKVPTLIWEGLGRWTTRHLPLPIGEITKLRERIILETALTYRPNLLLVDHSPVGGPGDLVSTLQMLRGKGDAAVVLGMRDIVSASETVRDRWRGRESYVLKVLENLYDEIWVYGCQALYDPIREYGLPDSIARKIHFCGYLGSEAPAPPAQEIRRNLGVEGATFVLVTVGGGRAAFPVLDTYLRALEHLPEEVKIDSLLVGGPDLSQEEQALVRHRCDDMRKQQPERRVTFTEFSPRLLEYMTVADLVVSMGGYNTLVEILALEKRALVIPRVVPDVEQFVRASLFERLGLVRMLPPDQLSPKAMAAALVSALHAPPPTRERLEATGVDLNGLARLAGHVSRLLDGSTSSPRSSIPS